MAHSTFSGEYFHSNTTHAGSIVQAFGGRVRHALDCSAFTIWAVSAGLMILALVPAFA